MGGVLIFFFDFFFFDEGVRSGPETEIESAGLGKIDDFGENGSGILFFCFVLFSPSIFFFPSSSSSVVVVLGGFFSFYQITKRHGRIPK